MESVFARRREELMRRIGPRAIALVHGARLARRNSDVDHRFRQSSNLLYLTDCREPDAFAVLAPGRSERFVMFTLPRDPAKEIWTGRRLGVDGAKAELGADAAHPIDDLPARLVEIADGIDEVHYLIGDEERVDRLVLSTFSQLRGGERRGLRAPLRLVDLRLTLHEMRLIKDEEGLACMRRAAAVTVDAHLAAMRATRPGVTEVELEALLDRAFRRGGGDTGYGTIVAGGANATVLHYVENSATLRDGDLLLVDAGGEVDGFGADISRTWPVGGRFTALQRRAYEIVLETEKQCIAMVRPGATIDEIHQHAVRRLSSGMARLGLLQGSPDEIVAAESYKRYYPHRTSHWLGLDVHDVGAYSPDGKPRPLEPGMVLTVEPGLYVPDDDQQAPPELRGLGIRVEDDVLVTGDGHEVLTAAMPKEVDEIERLVGTAPPEVRP